MFYFVLFLLLLNERNIIHDSFVSAAEESLTDASTFATTESDSTTTITASTTTIHLSTNSADDTSSTISTPSNEEASISTHSDDTNTTTDDTDDSPETSTINIEEENTLEPIDNILKAETSSNSQSKTTRKKTKMTKQLDNSTTESDLTTTITASTTTAPLSTSSEDDISSVDDTTPSQLITTLLNSISSEETTIGETVSTTDPSISIENTDIRYTTNFLSPEKPNLTYFLTDNSLTFVTLWTYEIFRMILTMTRCHGGPNGSEIHLCSKGTTCVLRYKVYAENLTVETSYGCQRYRYYTRSIENVCQDPRMPNVIRYQEVNTSNMYFKYCCTGNMCNSPGVYYPLVPKQFSQREVKEHEHLHIIEVAGMFIILIIAAWPYYIYYRQRREDQRLRTCLDESLERGILIVEQRPQKFFSGILKIRCTGQLRLRDITKCFANMETFERQRAEEVAQTARVAFSEYVMLADGNGHGIQIVNRSNYVSYDTMFQNLLEHGPYRYAWKPIELVEIFDQAKDYFESENCLLHLSLPIAIIGDIRGQYTDLHRWLSILGCPPKRKLLFLGGVIDPNEQGSLDCLAFIAAMKVAFPLDVFMLRGIGETIPISFPPRFGTRNDTVVQSAASRLCAHLPLAARISKKIFAVHSGISHQLSNPKCFNTVERPFEEATMPILARQLIFNQPTLAINMYRNDPANNMEHFGFGAVNRVCSDMEVQLIVRSRNPVPGGHAFLAKEKMISIWGAPSKGNAEKGSSLVIDTNLEVSIFSIQRQELTKAKDNKETTIKNNSIEAKK